MRDHGAVAVEEDCRPGRVAADSLAACEDGIRIVAGTLKGLVRPEEIAARRGLPIEHVAPAAMLRARAAAQQTAAVATAEEQPAGSGR